MLTQVALNTTLVRLEPAAVTLVRRLGSFSAALRELPDPVYLNQSIIGLDGALGALLPRHRRTRLRGCVRALARGHARARLKSERRYLSPDRQLTMRPTYSAPTGARIVALPQYGQES